jgi:putative transcriptional regulator
VSKKYRSDAMATIHETMEALHDVGAIYKQTTRRFALVEKMGLPPSLDGSPSRFFKSVG